jgi:hypothetical protein
LGSLGRTTWYSARHSSTTAAAAAVELGKASARVASIKGRIAKERKRKSGRRDAPRRASSSPWRPAWILRSRARQMPSLASYFSLDSRRSINS